MSQLNLEKIRTAAKEMPIAADVLSMWKDRARGRQDVTVNRTMRLLAEQGKKHKREDLSRFLTVLQDAGAGRLVFSKNKPARFVLDFNLKSIAKAVLSHSGKARVERQAPPRVILPEVTATVLQAASAVPQPEQQVSAQVIPMPVREENVDQGAMVIRRAGFEVTLPLDLTPAQAKAATILLSGLNA